MIMILIARLQRSPRLLAVLALAALAIVLAGCGSGGSSSTPATTESGATTTKATTQVATTNGTEARSSRRSEVPAKAEGSAPFRVAHGDNSVPDFGAEATIAERRLASVGLKGYLTARARGNWSAACSFLEAPARAKLEELAKSSNGRFRGCTAILGHLAGRSPGATRASPFSGEIAALRIKGGHGFALFVGSTGQQYVMPLARERSGWKVAQLAPIPYPLSSGSAPTG